MIITIDGPAGTGKTTIARRVAASLGYRYFDTGAMYRALTFALMQRGIEIEDTKALTTFLKGFSFDVREGRYFAQGEDVTEAIRSPEVTQKVSAVSALAEVRQALLGVQRQFAMGKDSVFEGRDMGTVVFPQADLKIFLTAAPEERARRRHLEWQEKHPERSQADVLQEILKRDALDANREIAPLKQAEDAHLIDTSHLSIDQVVNSILALL